MGCKGKNSSWHLIGFADGRYIFRGNRALLTMTRDIYSCRAITVAQVKMAPIRSSQDLLE